MIKIDKRIPLPSKPCGVGRPDLYPWAVMNVGDSFLIAGGNSQSAASMAYTAGKRNDRKFAVRSVDGGVRVWRIE